MNNLPTVHKTPTAFKDAPTLYQLTEQGPGPGDPSAGPQGQPPGPPASGTPVALPPEGADKWAMLEFFAKRASACVLLEQDLKDMFEKRQVIARRLLDAARRRDDTQAAEAAKTWLSTEIKLAQLMVQYEPMMQEREAVLRQVRSGG